MNMYLDALVCCIIYLYDSYLGWKKGSKNQATSPLSPDYASVLFCGVLLNCIMILQGFQDMQNYTLHFVLSNLGHICGQPFNLGCK